MTNHVLWYSILGFLFSLSNKNVPKYPFFITCLYVAKLQQWVTVVFPLTLLTLSISHSSGCNRLSKTPFFILTGICNTAVTILIIFKCIVQWH